MLLAAQKILVIFCRISISLERLNCVSCFLNTIFTCLKFVHYFKNKQNCNINHPPGFYLLLFIPFKTLDAEVYTILSCKSMITSN